MAAPSNSFPPNFGHGSGPSGPPVHGSPPPIPGAGSEGKTLWEMFTGWAKKKLGAGGDEDDAEANKRPPNPLEWSPGVPVTLNVSHGPEFADGLIIVESVRHCVRKLGRHQYGFVDYVVRATPRTGKISRVLIRCFPRSEGVEGWDKLLLRRHDEFGYAKEFEDLLADETGQFNIDAETPEGPPASYTRLHGLRGSWEVFARMEHQEHSGAQTKQSSVQFRYWDYSRPADDGEEFLFIEINAETGWTELWRGSSFVI